MGRRGRSRTLGYAPGAQLTEHGLPVAPLLELDGSQAAADPLVESSKRVPLIGKLEIRLPAVQEGSQFVNPRADGPPAAPGRAPRGGPGDEVRIEVGPGTGRDRSDRPAGAPEGPGPVREERVPPPGGAGPELRVAPPPPGGPRGGCGPGVAPGKAEEHGEKETQGAVHEGVILSVGHW